MAWSTFPTLTDGQVLTGAHMQAAKADFDETATAKVATSGQYVVSTAANTLAARTPGVDSIAAAENTTSTSYADITTVGPTVTVTCGAAVLVLIHTRITNNTANVNTRAGFVVSGASTFAATNGLAAVFEPTAAGQDAQFSMSILFNGLTSGSNTFKVVYKVDSASTGTFSDRRLSIVPF